MIQLLLPKCADNCYRGQKIALWILGLVATIKALQGLMSAFNTYATITGADGIAVNTFPPAAASAAMALFALLGYRLFLIAAMPLVALARYRSLAPLMFTLLIGDYLGSRLVLRLHPLDRTGAAVGVYVNAALFALMLIGLALSLWKRESDSH